jgi:non-canonical (house-cleaning) NTP pyrophosphatase
MRVIVGSISVIKLDAVKASFITSFGNIPVLFETCDVSSGVREQPVGENETFLGASNRAKSVKSLYPHADMWIGIENGMFRQTDRGESRWVDKGIIVVLSHSATCKTCTDSFDIPLTALKTCINPISGEPQQNWSKLKDPHFFFSYGKQSRSRIIQSSLIPLLTFMSYANC